MSEAISNPPWRRGLPALAVLFAGSGCAALIYEIVWFQLLELVIGSSAISLGLLLGAFMGGMCLGSLAMPRCVAPGRHPLRVYACVELGIGAMGLLLLFGMPLITGLYTAWSGPGVAGMVIRGMVAAACLLPPTFLMGATLPVIARWVEATPRGASWLGLFYGGNIAGAVVGSLLTGFYLLRFHDAAVATCVAAALNLIVAGFSLYLVGAAPYESFADSPPRAARSEFNAALPPGSWRVYLMIAVSGMTALAAEVIWTRLLALMFGATVYAFSLILAIFLLGLGLGASAGAAWAGRSRRPRAALGACQLLLCGALAWAAYQMAASLPYWPVDPAKAADLWYMMRLDFTRSLWAVLPAAILWGASFPLALASLASGRQDPGRWAGRVYAANTVGTIIGALGASLWLVASIGSRRTQQLLIAASALSGLLALAPLRGAWFGNRGRRFAAVAAIALLGAGLLIRAVPAIPPELIAYGRLINALDHGKVIFSAEGLTTSVAVSRGPDGEMNYHSAGKIQASSEYQDMRLQRMLGHLTTLVPANPRRFLVIGLGAGVTAGAVSIEPRRERETIVDIEPLVPKVIAQFFRPYNFDVLNRPDVFMDIDDGRHFLLTIRETFDGITSDPLDPWVKGTAALYTKEFFELEKSHLNPGGVVTQFVQLYESSEEAVKSEIATFFDVFPNGLVFANNVMGQGYDLVLLGRASPEPIDLDRMEKLLDTADYAPVAQSLEEIGFYSAADLLSTYVAQAADLRSWLQGAAINRDRDLRLQYLAGAGLNLHDGGRIFAHMTAFGPRMPDGVFKGSDELLEYLRRAIESGSSRY